MAYLITFIILYLIFGFKIALILIGITVLVSAYIIGKFMYDTNPRCARYYTKKW